MGVKSYLLFLGLLGGVSHAAEWILTRSPERVSWQTLSESLPDLHFVKAFGPELRFALFHGPRPRLSRIAHGIESIQPNYSYSLLESDPDFSKSWALENSGQSVGVIQGVAGKDIGAKPAWAIHSGSRAVVIAVLDSGIDLGHEDLSANLWRNDKEIADNKVDDDGNGHIDDVHGWNFVDSSAQIQDDNDHGSLCSGIIAATAENGKGSRGVLKEVSLMALKTLDSGGFGSTANAISAIYYAVKNGAQIINVSWGGKNYDPALREAIQWAGNHGVLFVAASGNDGNNNDSNKQAAIYPASFDLKNLISVAAYDARDKLAGFSNFGKHSVHLGAPGVGIFSTARGGYRWVEGTSYAAPFVSAVAGLIKSFAPSVTLEELRERLLLTSEVISYYDKERTYSAGRVHAANALLNRRPVRPEPPSDWVRHKLSLATAHPYTNNDKHTYRVYHPGASYLRVHFSRFETEPRYDTVTLKDRNNTVVMTYSGDLGSFWSADVLGDVMYIEFVTDIVTTGFGFEIDRYEESDEGNPWAWFISPFLKPFWTITTLLEKETAR